jgi:hypothetical protein
VKLTAEGVPAVGWSPQQGVPTQPTRTIAAA